MLNTTEMGFNKVRSQVMSLDIKPFSHKLPGLVKVFEEARHLGSEANTYTVWDDREADEEQPLLSWGFHTNVLLAEAFEYSGR